MANLNKVMLIGRLTRDPETRSIQSGSSVTQLGLAVNRTYVRRDSGEKVEETCFVDAEAWGRTGETIQRYMSKGRQIFIEGRLKFDSWERDGQRRSKLSVVVENFQFIDSQGGGGDREGHGAQGESAGGQAASGQASSGQGAPVGAGGGAPADDDIPF